MNNFLAKAYYQDFAFSSHGTLFLRVKLLIDMLIVTMEKKYKSGPTVFPRFADIYGE